MTPWHIFQMHAAARRTRWLNPRALLRGGGRVLLLAGLLVLLPWWQSSAAAQAAASGCTYMIPPEVTKVDGAKNFAQVKPGDTLCFPAGTRGNIRLFNLHGAPGQPVTVRNAEGVVIITGKDLQSGGINVQASSYLRITGSGVESHCGADFQPENQRCGIEIRDTTKGILVNTRANNVHHLEIDHVLVNGTSQASSAVGIAIHPLENQMIDGFSVHHNYISNTGNEGIYIGTEPDGRSLDILGKLQNVEVSYNRVEQTGFDGIKLKVVVANVKVHHNVILWPARLRTPNHQGGILLVLSVGDFYNNFVLTDQQGIYMGRILQDPDTRYFNNVVVGAKMAGIHAPEAHPQIFNNTVVASGPAGIQTESDQALVYNNILVDDEVSSFQLVNQSDADCTNFTGTIAAAGFLDPAGFDFRLSSLSPLVNTGCDRLPAPGEDYRGVVRPQGDRVEPGAYEYVPPTGLKSRYDRYFGRY